jgi:hypothetical protein
VIGEQLAVDEPRDRLRRTGTDSLPRLIDHRARRLAANLVCQTLPFDLGDQRRWDQHDRVVAKPPDRPRHIHHGRQMSRATNRAGQQHMHIHTLTRHWLTSCQGGVFEAVPTPQASVR